MEDLDGDVDTVARSTSEPATLIEGSRRHPRVTEPSRGSQPSSASSQPSQPSQSSQPAPLPIGDASSTIASPLGALRHDEILRTRRFCVLGVIISLCAAASVPLLPGDPIAARFMLAAILIASGGMAYLLHRTRSPATFHGPAIAFAWYLPAACVTTAIPYFGVFSPAPIVLVLGIYFTGLGQSRSLALGIYFTCALAQAAIAALVIGRVVHDPGIIHVEYLATSTQIVAQVLVQVVLLCTLVIARQSRRTALLALGELERVVRAVSQREALLHEARQDLERALRAGKTGRFTEQTLGHYVLGNVIGRGAMGEVYEATDRRNGEPAAVKLLSQASLSNPTHVRRFLRELEAAAAIDSPNVVKVYAVGDAPLPYLVMERLEGRDLSEILRGQRALPSPQVIDLVRQVGAGVRAAAAAGVVHRDLKPQNLFLHQGTWKVLDFGVSRVADQSDTLTSGHVVGTPAYMAPEQARGGMVDHRADLYALAAIAYRALTGRPPFAAGEIAETLYRVVHTAPLRPSWLAELHDDVDLVLAIGMAKDPAHRFAAAIELAEALAAAIAGGLPESLRARGRARVEAGAWAVT